MVDIGTLQKMHPTWNLVDAIAGPNGQGIIALGSDGGIFSLDATGDTTGLTAPLAYTDNGAFSFTTLPAGQRAATVPFKQIQVNKTGGYDIINTNEQTYSFNPRPPDKPTSAPTVDKTGTTQATDTSPTANNASDVSGSGALHAILDPIGLGSIADKAIAALHSTPGADAAYITTVWLPGQKEYKDAFPEIAATQAQVAAGNNVHIPTPADIVAYRQYANQLVTQGIIPAEFVTNDKVGKLIEGGVDLPEFQRRILNGVDKLTNADQADRDAFMAYHPAMDFSHAVAAFLDPTLSEAAIGRTIAQAEVGGAARRSGFGNVTADEATGLAAAGQGTQAQFTNLALEQPLFQNLAGETGTITHGEQLGTLTGNAQDIAEIERRRAQRQAAFQGGGGAASGGTGNQGLGAAK